MGKLRKLSEMWSDFISTRTVEGPFLYFHLIYVWFLLIRAMRFVSPKLGNAVDGVFDREFLIKNRIGRFSVNAKNDSFHKSLPGFESTSQSWLGAPKVKDVFIDIGANIGFYSILALNRYGYKQAYAFEPNPETFKRLEKNFALNEFLDNALAVDTGLSNENKTARLAIKKVHTGASSLAPIGERHFDGGLDVAVQTFDSFVVANNLNPKRISFIKIDVEGYEFEALSGMRYVLSKLAPDTHLMIEIHPHSATKEKTQHIIKDSGFIEIHSTPTHNFLYRKAV